MVRLIDIGIFDMPDENVLHFGNAVSDGICYVVEFKLEDWYRTYHYCNPDRFDLVETKRMSNLVKLLKQYTPMNKLPCNEGG